MNYDVFIAYLLYSGFSLRSPDINSPSERARSNLQVRHRWKKVSIPIREEDFGYIVIPPDPEYHLGRKMDITVRVLSRSMTLHEAPDTH